jgi:hypothetical protein
VFTWAVVQKRPVETGLTLPAVAEVGSSAHVHLHPIAALKRQAFNQRFLNWGLRSKRPDFVWAVGSGSEICAVPVSNGCEAVVVIGLI